MTLSYVGTFAWRQRGRKQRSKNRLNWNSFYLKLWKAVAETITFGRKVWVFGKGTVLQTGRVMLKIISSFLNTSIIFSALCYLSSLPVSPSTSHLLFLTHPQGPREGCLYSLSTLSPCFSHLLPQPWRLSTHGWIYDPSIPRFYHLSLISQIKTHAFLSWALLVFTLVGWTLLRWTISTYIHAKLLRLCLTLCDPMDCSPSGPSVHGILQARILGWVAMSFSRGSSWPRDRTRTSCIGRWVPYHWATREAINRKYLLKDNLECHQMITNHDQINKCQGEVNGKTCIFFNYTTKAT